jgi:hypothetical protein
MAAKQQLCAYCGKAGARREMTQEHFVPKCLWEGHRPNRTLTVWVHHACNAGYSRDDEFFRTALVAMNGTERHPEAASVLQGTLARVMRKRPGVFLGHLGHLDFGPIESPSGLYLGNALTFTLDVPRFFRILRKIVLGLYYCKIGKPLPGDHGVHLAWENRHTRPVVEPLFPHMHSISDFGDDVFIYRWMRDPDDDRRTFWGLGFYKAVSFFAATLPEPEQPQQGGALHFLNVSPMSAWSRV